MFCSLACSPGVDPWAAGFVGFLECANGIVPSQRQHDLVEAFEEASPAAGIDVEAMDLAGGRRDGLRLKVNRDAARALAFLDLGHEAIDDGLVDDDREDAVLEAVGEEDVA